MDWLDLLAVQGTLKSSPAAQFKTINSLVLNLLYSPILTPIHDYWKNHSFHYTDLCWQSDVSAFQPATVFPVVMYGRESWTIKKPEHQRIDAFELWCWGRLLRVPWTARRSNQSILREVSPWCSLEGLVLKLKLQYFGHLMQRAESFEKTSDSGKD